jgi:hypothetical protein
MRVLDNVLSVDFQGTRNVDGVSNVRFLEETELWGSSLGKLDGVFLARVLIIFSLSFFFGVF